ncbi:hypothetical protein PLICRDRAFT_102023 [Plicaturopsis crispa FD-325 SS-3]|nr:hypothetical protein PLICRDRAFT_102023 [Plicaturopsis crispa FD-325 SS-3]
MSNFTSTADVSKFGNWGPVTATLDWCEANYQFSHYIAEMANTYSNLFSIGLALHGIRQAHKESLPSRYLLSFAGFAMIGFGSFAFHATLLFRAQLADELPMIYVATYTLYLLFETSPGFSMRRSPHGKALLGATLLFDALFTWSYMMYRNPVYHQVVFGAIMFALVGRSSYLLRSSSNPSRARTTATIENLYLTGAAIFILGFFVWNLDNIFCDTLTQWKTSIGWPPAFLLEGHSWWHLFTGIGTYLMLLATTCKTLCVKDDYRNYTLGWTSVLPHVRRVRAVKVQ